MRLGDAHLPVVPWRLCRGVAHLLLYGTVDACFDAGNEAASYRKGGMEGRKGSDDPRLKRGAWRKETRTAGGDNQARAA